MAPTKGGSSTSQWAGSSDVAAIVAVEQPQAVVVGERTGVEVPVRPNIVCDHVVENTVVTHMLTQESENDRQAVAP